MIPLDQGATQAPGTYGQPGEQNTGIAPVRLGMGRMGLPRTRSSFHQMGGTAQAPTAPTPLTQSSSTTGGAGAAGANGVDTQALVQPAVPSAGSSPTTGFAASNPVTPVAIGSASTFSPTSNSVGSVVAPATSDRLAGMQAQSDAALKGVTQTPDRYALAQQQYGTFADQTDPEYQATLRDATKLSSANGTMGSGMLRTRYGDLALQRGRDLQNERDSLFQTAQQQTMADRQATLAATMGAEGQVNSQDAANRNEQRTERDYQANRGDTALAQMLNQRQVEDGLTGTAFNRAALQTEMGYGNDPALAQLTAAGQSGQQAAGSFNDVGSLLRTLALSKGGDINSILQSLGAGGGSGGFYGGK